MVVNRCEKSNIEVWGIKAKKVIFWVFYCTQSYHIWWNFFCPPIFPSKFCPVDLSDYLLPPNFRQLTNWTTPNVPSHQHSCTSFLYSFIMSSFIANKHCSPGSIVCFQCFVMFMFMYLFTKYIHHDLIVKIASVIRWTIFWFTWLLLNFYAHL